MAILMKNICIWSKSNFTTIW